MSRTALAFLSFLCISAIASGQDALRLTPRPAWVDELPIDHRVGEGALRGTVDYLLIDHQDDARGDVVESYVHVAKRVLNEQGVQYESELAIDFDPTYQSLAVHAVLLRRDGAQIDELAARSFEVIQREQQLEQQVYEGTRTALLFLDDVRVGDVIDYEYTIRGRSPLFDGRYFSSRPVQLTVPVQRLRRRILWPNGRELHVRSHGTQLEPDVRSLEAGHEFVWDLHDLAALSIESDLPTWCQPFPWIQTSEFDDWRDVARWGAGLFALAEPTGPKVRAAAAKFREEASAPDEQLRRALRFVQGEIRYLSIALGEGAHRPSPPEQVLERRYGDCKDKALLLVALLRELGIDARPALVNTTALHTVADWLPTPAAFDHVIVRALLDGRELWVDPTLSQERGPLSEQALLDYGRALLLDGQVGDLVAVERDQGAQPLTAIEKVFRVSLTGPTSFTVETAYEGPDANLMRSSLGWSTTSELTGRCRDFYMADYPSLTVEQPVEVVDQAEQNRIVVRERYSIADFWGRSKREGWGRFHAGEISEELRVPETTRRQTPAGIAHPRRVTCRTIALLPEQWEVEPETVRVHNGSMHFEQQVAYAGARLELRHEYRSLRDHVPAAECAAFAADIEKIRDELAYEISDPRAVNAAGQERSDEDWVYGLLGVAVVVGLGLLGALVGVIVWASRKNRAGVVQIDEGRGVWRSGTLVVLDRDSELPPRCFFCNGEESVRIKRRLSWHSPWLYLLILTGLLIYAIVATCVNQRAQLTIPLCRTHQRRRQTAIGTAWGLTFVGLGSCVAGATDQGLAPMMLLGSAAVLAALIVGFRPRLRPARIDDRRIELRGAGKAFLESLPDSNGEVRRAA